ncbi:serine O-acetyltransferase [Leptolyngbya sp. Heron Island J]|uniref:serine O-acetyltransferase n=1 Tax=Leptolyngbya sp. Heron Island J TaxID=1385935 RepID=UPI0006844D7C|nr:serine acetyltransferase [Leptolyngbya sp. Heron Island J]
MTQFEKYTFSGLFSDIRSDLQRNSKSFHESLFRLLFNPSIRVLLYYRLSHWLYKKKFHKSSYIINSWQNKYGCYISRKSELGKHVRLVHPIGIVIGDGVVIEDDVAIWQNCTLGSHGKDNTSQSYPYVESGVRIYAGAVVVGGVRIGKNSVIGANSVVLSDVPENSLAVGVPYKRK